MAAAPFLTAHLQETFNSLLKACNRPEPRCHAMTWSCSANICFICKAEWVLPSFIWSIQELKSECHRRLSAAAFVFSQEELLLLLVKNWPDWNGHAAAGLGEPRGLRAPLWTQNFNMIPCSRTLVSSTPGSPF